VPLSKGRSVSSPRRLPPSDGGLGPIGLGESILGAGPVFLEASLCLDAAVAGQGVFLGRETLARDVIAMGRLVAAIRDWLIFELAARA
jgi:DNA-binding transcriptional LysR family regulator